MSDDRGPVQVELLEKLKQWLASPQGKTQSQSALESAREATARLEKARVLHPDELNRPVTL